MGVSKGTIENFYKWELLVMGFQSSKCIEARLLAREKKINRVNNILDTICIKNN